MQTYPAGTEVKTRFADVTGIITAAEIRYEHLRYEMTYFNPADNTFVSSWHHESELEVCGKVQKRQIVYKK